MCFAAERGLPRLRATNTGQEYKDPQFATEEESGLVNLGQQYQVRFKTHFLWEVFVMPNLSPAQLCARLA